MLPSLSCQRPLKCCHEVCPWWGRKPMLFLQVTYATSPSGNWEICQKSRSAQESIVHLRARKEPCGLPETREAALWLCASPAAPELSFWPSSLCLASAASLWKPQSWQLSHRTCSITEQRPHLLCCWGRREQCWCPHAPRRRRAPSCTDPSNLVHRLITNAPSSTSKLAYFSAFLQNRNYVGHFLPQPQNRKEMGTANLVQLLILLLKDFFFFNSNSLFGFPSHLYNLPHSPLPPPYPPFTKSPD